MDANLAEQKAQLRKAMGAARGRMGPLARASAATRLYARLMGLRGRTIAGYLPIGSELDPTGAMRVLAHTNTVCVPVVTAKGAPLRFREWWPGCPVEKGAFDVMVPTEGGWRVPDTLIVPLLAFDAAGTRLGYGGGFYDRTLAGMPQAHAIGFALEAQRTASVPKAATDIQMSIIVTEKGVFAPPDTG